MGDDLFDDLARALAKPMPRRKALRMLAAGLAAAATPGITARRAGGARRVTPPCSSPGAGTFCGYPDHGGYNIGCCLKGSLSVCCPGQSGVKGSWCCPTGFTCGGLGPNTASDPNCKCNGVVNPRTGECNCPWPKVCGNTCCKDHERCNADGECEACDSEDRCGNDCCAIGMVCRNPARGLCCVKAWKPCQAGLAGVSKCCPPMESCCFNHTTKAVKCCGPGVECQDGRCKCTKTETRCGDDCCKKGEVCSNGLCCAKGLVNCDGKCCKPHLCVASAGKKTCCPLERIATPGGVPVCCPPGTLPSAGNEGICCSPGNPDCCDQVVGGGVTITTFCARGRVCVNGNCH